MKSILQDKKVCFKCGTPFNLHEHHIFEGTSNRKQSEKYGLKIYLCGYHHNLSDEGIHFNKDYDLVIKQMAQEKFEEIHGHKKFMEVFGRNYIGIENKNSEWDIEW